MRRFLLFLTVACAALAAGCNAIPSKPATDDTSAMRTALESYLSQRGNLNMAGMEMDLQVTRNDGKTADVNVTFRARQGGGSMQMAYQLEKQGDLWTVKGSQSPADSSHPAVGAGAAPPAGELPAAHPPLTPPAAPAKKP